MASGALGTPLRNRAFWTKRVPCCRRHGGLQSTCKPDLHLPLPGENEMTQKNSRSIHSVWTRTVELAPSISTAKVELTAETIRKVSADIESRSEAQARLEEPALNVEALRTLYT